MIEVLQLEDDVRAYPHPACRDIEEFRVLIERDDTDHSREAARELAYVYHMCDPKSPYADQERNLRKEQVGADLFGDKEYSPEEEVEAAMDKYRALNITESMQLLESARESVHSLREYFEQADFTQRDDNGKLVWKPKDMVRNLEKLGDVVESLKTLKEEVEKEQHSQGDNRGGVKTNKYSK
jgi:hypothetical protein